MDSNPLASFALGGLGAQHGKMSDSDSDIEVLSPVAGNSSLSSSFPPLAQRDLA